MSSQERRRSPRKECLVPLRFRIIGNGNGNGNTAAGRHAVNRTVEGGSATRSDRISATESGAHAHFGMAEGRAENLSERGVYFVSRERVTVGEEVELFFTLPAELTGRAAESVRCNARVVFAQPLEREPGLTGAGVSVRCYEAIARARSWAN
jgi:hypothetical protein